MRKKFLVLLTMILGLGIFTQPTSALSAEDFSIALYPSQQTIELSAGQTKKGSVSVANSGLIPFDFKASVAPYQLDDEDNPSFTTVNKYTDLANWIKFEQDTYHVEPGETVTVDFTINVPETAVGGGQYAAILAYTEDGMDKNASFRVASQVAGLIYARVSGEEMRPNGKLVSWKIPGFIMDGDLTVSETTTNTGNVDFSVYHAIRIEDFFSGKQITISGDTGNNEVLAAESNNSVLPETTSTDTLFWRGAPKLGVFRVTQTIIFLDDSFENSKIVVFCPLWLIIAVISLIVLLIIIICLMIRSHKRKAPQVF